MKELTRILTEYFKEWYNAPEVKVELKALNDKDFLVTYQLYENGQVHTKTMNYFQIMAHAPYVVG